MNSAQRLFLSRGDSALRRSARRKIARLAWMLAACLVSDRVARSSDESSSATAQSGPPVLVRATLPIWHHDGLQADGGLGQRVASAGDVDADGFDDVIVSAPEFDDVWADIGRVYVFRGGSKGPATQPSWSARGDRPYAHFGDQVAAAGDVNGDQYADVLVTSVDGLACAYLFLGSEAGLGTQPAWTFEKAAYHGSKPPSVSSAGDLDADGYCDVIVGSPWTDSAEAHWGRVAVFRGSSSGLSLAPDRVVHGSEFGMDIGRAVVGFGDADDDGIVDCAFAAEGHSWYSSSPRVIVFEGIPPVIDPNHAIQAPALGIDSGFGFVLASAGDVTGDGCADLLVGAPYAALPWKPRVGYAALFSGGSGGIASAPTSSRFGEAEYDCFGSALAGGGDLDGDGLCDVVIGDLRPGHSRAFVFMGTENGLAPDPAWARTSLKPAEQFGRSVAMTGSIDGASRPSVLVGSPNRGQYIHHGGRAELFDLSHSATRFVPGDRLLGSLGGVGDRRFAEFEALSGTKLELAFAPTEQEARIRVVLRGQDDRVRRERTIEVGPSGAKTSFTLRSPNSRSLEFRLLSGSLPLLDIHTKVEAIPDSVFLQHGFVKYSSRELEFEALAGSTCDIQAHRSEESGLFASQFRLIPEPSAVEPDLFLYASIGGTSDLLFTGVPISATGTYRFRALYGQILYGGPVEVTIEIHPPNAEKTIRTLVP